MNLRTATFLLAAVVAVPAFPDTMPQLRPLGWEQIEAQVSRSLVALEETDVDGSVYTCSGFIIDRGRELALTANHCVELGVPFTVDGKPSYVVYARPDLDMAVVVNPGNKKPALKRRDDPVRYGTLVGALGYGYSLGSPIFKQGAIANPYVQFVARDNDGLFAGPWVMTDFPLVGGMSGGPMFDLEGKVFGVVQRTDNLTGTTRPLGDMLAATSGYWR